MEIKKDIDFGGLMNKNMLRNSLFIGALLLAVSPLLAADEQTFDPSVQRYFPRLFGCTDFVDSIHSVSDLRFNVQRLTFNVL